MQFVRLTSIAVLSTVLTCGCGGNTGSGGPPDGGGSGKSRYGEPSDFSHVDCPGVGSIAELDPAGIWHMDLDFGRDGTFAGATRLDRVGDGFDGLMNGGALSEVLHTATDLYVRRTWLSDGDVLRTRAFNVCAVDEDGSLRGQYVTCRVADCFLASVHLIRVVPMDEPVAEGLELLDEIGAAWPTDTVALNVRVAGGIAFVARGTDGLRIVSVQDPTRLVELSHLAVSLEGSEFYNDVKVVDAVDGKRYAFLASTTRGVVTVDVSDPQSPIEVGHFPAPPLGESRVNIHTIFLEGDRAYLTNVGTAGLDIFDIADPVNPIRLGEFILPALTQFGGVLHDLFVSEGRAYLNYWDKGMVIVDSAADPANPVVVGAFDGSREGTESRYDRRTSHSVWVTEAGGRRIAVHGDEDIGAHVRIVDVDAASVAFLNEIGSYETRPEVSVHNIMAVGELALVTYYQDGLRLLDLADPTDPREIAHYRSWDPSLDVASRYGESFFEGAIGVDYAQDTGIIYVVDTHRGLLTLRQVP